MLPHGMIVSAVLSAWLISTCLNSAAESPASSDFRRFAARGVVRELKADGSTVVLSHEAITNYMDAMTMPFKVKEPRELMDLRPGDPISFRLSVTETESWIDQVAKIARATPALLLWKRGLGRGDRQNQPTIRSSITSSPTNWA